MLKKMRSQNQRLKNVINELLRMLRVETEGIRASAEPVEILPLVERVLNLVRYEQPHHVFSLDTNNRLSMVIADATKTELILLNLLLSAVRRCPDGGHIAVQLEQRTSKVSVSITDDGKSIPVKLLDRAFWQFYPVDDEGGKMPSTYQLGLYTTKQFVELQNGRIWAESQSGKGSKFSFSMPVWEKG
jgi:signal transduction histidine kinase